MLSEQLLNSMDKKLNETIAFLVKESDSVYKDIAAFVKEMLKCPICYENTKDEVPHATSCCNHVFCLPCVSELSARQDDKCLLASNGGGLCTPFFFHE